MKKLYSLSVLTFLCLISSVSADAQQYWQKTSIEALRGVPTDKSVARLSFPTELKLFDLNLRALRPELFTVGDKHKGNHSTIISLPNVSGQKKQ